jgi:diguanylate cyclase (GGDEF)-like protein
VDHATGPHLVVDGAWTDEETRLPSTAFWALVLATEAARCRRYRRTATVVAVEIEGADRVASVWGPEIAIRVGQAVSTALAAEVRASDYLVRAADGTFLVLLPETDEVAAVNFVERARPRCDASLESLRAPARCAFGWADARGDRDLLAAADLARERIASDIVEDRG